MAEENESSYAENHEDTYELIIPPGIPSKVIIAASKKFDLDVVEVYGNVESVFNETTSRDLLAFRSDKETIEQIRAFLIEETRKFIDE